MLELRNVAQNEAEGDTRKRRRIFHASENSRGDSVSLPFFQIIFGTLAVIVAFHPNSRWGRTRNPNNPPMTRFQRGAFLVVGVVMVGFGTFALLSR
jgi:hypothetical protein